MDTTAETFPTGKTTATPSAADGLFVHKEIITVFAALILAAFSTLTMICPTLAKPESTVHSVSCTATVRFLTCNGNTPGFCPGGSFVKL